MVTLQGKAVSLYGKPIEVGQFAPIVYSQAKISRHIKLAEQLVSISLLALSQALMEACAKHKHAPFIKRYLHLRM